MQENYYLYYYEHVTKAELHSKHSSNFGNKDSYFLQIGPHFRNIENPKNRDGERNNIQIVPKTKTWSNKFLPWVTEIWSIFSSGGVTLHDFLGENKLLIRKFDLTWYQI